MTLVQKREKDERSVLWEVGPKEGAIELRSRARRYCKNQGFICPLHPSLASSAKFNIVKVAKTRIWEKLGAIWLFNWNEPQNKLMESRCDNNEAKYVLSFFSSSKQRAFWTEPHNGITSPPVSSHRCVLRSFLTMPVSSCFLLYPLTAFCVFSEQCQWASIRFSPFLARCVNDIWPADQKLSKVAFRLPLLTEGSFFKLSGSCHFESSRCHHIRWWPNDFSLSRVSWKEKRSRITGLPDQESFFKIIFLNGD